MESDKSTSSDQASDASISEKPLIRISPPQFDFLPSRNGNGYVSRLSIRNMLGNSIGFKFKTNAPTRYSVKPVLATLGPHESLEIYVRSDSEVKPGDKFLMQSISLTDEEARQLDARFWRELDRRRVMENLIACRVAQPPVAARPEQEMKKNSRGEKLDSALHWMFAVRYTRIQLLIISFLCILVGFILPIERYIHVFYGGEMEDRL
ncbi:uncharacterized protein VTP21DRAFT_8959 [Calcarisporiella thermophila]|uniref:uncharacterized protein n=1 Tax=Calcarisporiella thermophila TaxID=911321 RepID=UPI00374476F1